MPTSIVGSKYATIFYVNAGPYVPNATLTAIPMDGSDPVYDITYTPPASGATTDLTLTMTIRNKSSSNALYPVIRLDIGWPTGDSASANNLLTKIPSYIWAADPIFRPLFRINGYATQYKDNDNRGCYAVPYLYGEAGTNGIKSPIVAFSDNTGQITAIATNIGVPFAFYRTYDSSNNMVVDIVPGTDLPLYNAGIPAFLAPGESVTFSIWLSNIAGNTSGLLSTSTEAIATSGAVGHYLDWLISQKSSTKYNPKIFGRGIVGVDLALPDATTSSANRYYRTFDSTMVHNFASFSDLLDAIVKSITGKSTVNAAVQDLKERQISGILLRGLSGSSEDLGSKNFDIKNGYGSNGNSNTNMNASCANIFGQTFGTSTATQYETLSLGVFGPNTVTNGTVDIIDWYRVTSGPNPSTATFSMRSSPTTEYPVTFPHTQGMQTSGSVGTLASPCTRAQFLNFATTNYLQYLKAPLARIVLDWENTESVFDLMTYNQTEVETLPSESGGTNDTLSIQVGLFAKWLRLNDATYQALGTGPATQAARVNYIRPLFNAAVADMHIALIQAMKTQVDTYVAANVPGFNSGTIKYGVYSFPHSGYGEFAYSKTYSLGYPTYLRNLYDGNSTLWSSSSMTGFFPAVYSSYLYYNDIYFLGPGRVRNTPTQYNPIDSDYNKTLSECRLQVQGVVKEALVLAAKYNNQVVSPFFSERWFNGPGYLNSLFSYQYSYANVNQGSGFAADVAKRFIPPGTVRAILENIKAVGVTEATWWGQVSYYNNEEVEIANFMSKYLYNTFHSIMHPHGAAAYDKPKAFDNLPTNLHNTLDQIKTWSSDHGLEVYAWIPNAYRSYQSGAYDSALISAINNEIAIGDSLPSNINKRAQTSGVSLFLANNVNAALTYFSGVFMSNMPDAIVDPWISSILTTLRNAHPGKLMVAVGPKTDKTYGTVSPCLEDAHYMPNCPVMSYVFGSKLQTFVLQNEFDFGGHMGRTEDRFNYIISNGDVPVIFNTLPTNRTTGSIVARTSSDNAWQ